jgi:hypothetical protein
LLPQVAEALAEVSAALEPGSHHDHLRALLAELRQAVRVTWCLVDPFANPRCYIVRLYPLDPELLDDLRAAVPNIPQKDDQPDGQAHAGQTGKRKKAQSGAASSNLKFWGFGLEHSTVWRVCRCVRGQWQLHGQLGELSETQHLLLKGFAEGGGFLSETDALNRIGPNLPPGEQRTLLIACCMSIHRIISFPV